MSRHAAAQGLSASQSLPKRLLTRFSTAATSSTASRMSAALTVTPGLKPALVSLSVALPRMAATSFAWRSSKCPTSSSMSFCE